MDSSRRRSATAIASIVQQKGDSPFTSPIVVQATVDYVKGIRSIFAVDPKMHTEVLQALQLFDIQKLSHSERYRWADVFFELICQQFDSKGITTLEPAYNQFISLVMMDQSFVSAYNYLITANPTAQKSAMSCILTKSPGYSVLLTEPTLNMIYERFCIHLDSIAADVIVHTAKEFKKAPPSKAPLLVGMDKFISKAENGGKHCLRIALAVASLVPYIFFNILCNDTSQFESYHKRLTASVVLLRNRLLSDIHKEELTYNSPALSYLSVCLYVANPFEYLENDPDCDLNVRIVDPTKDKNEFASQSPPKATIQDYFDRFLLLAGQYHIFDPRTGYIDRDQSEIRYENLARPSAVLSAQNAGVDTSTPPIQKRSASRITPEKSYIQSLVATSLLQLTQTDGSLFTDCCPPDVFRLLRSRQAYYDAIFNKESTILTRLQQFDHRSQTTASLTPEEWLLSEKARRYEEVISFAKEKAASLKAAAEMVRLDGLTLELADEKKAKSTYFGPKYPHIEDILKSLNKTEFQKITEVAKQYVLLLREGLSHIEHANSNCALLLAESKQFMETLAEIAHALEQQMLVNQKSFLDISEDDLLKEQSTFKENINIAAEHSHSQSLLMCLQGVRICRELMEVKMEKSRANFVSLYSGKVDPKPVSQELHGPLSLEPRSMHDNGNQSSLCTIVSKTLKRVI
eukprot:gene6662-7540_t